MELADLFTELSTLLDPYLGTDRKGDKAIAIIPPDIENGVITGIACCIQRTPIGKRIPSRSNQRSATKFSGDNLDIYLKTWVVKLINFENSSTSSQSLAISKEIMEAKYRGRLNDNMIAYQPPSLMNKEMFIAKLVFPELVVAP